MVWLLLSYAAAAVVPGWGLWLRRCSLGILHLGGSAQDLSVPTLLLALMLLNASLSTDVQQLGRIFARPGLLCAGLCANTIIPIAFVALAGQALLSWADMAQARGAVVGLAILASMPIAASSIAWTQQAGGHVPLSLGLVLVSTALSPLLTPLIFLLTSAVVARPYGANLNDLAGTAAQLFLLVAVVLPCVLGLLLRHMVGGQRLQKVLPVLKILSKCYLLLLNYCNAAVALPPLLASPAWNYLAVVLAAATLLCGLRFFGGLAVGKMLHAPRHHCIATMFGLGMNNNGSGLTLAAQQLPHDGNVLLTIVAYNLAQQVAAGAAHHWMHKPHTEP